MITSRPQDPELPGLIGLQERDDAQTQLAVNIRVRDRKRQYETVPDQEGKLTEKERQLLYRNPCGWYSEQVRACISELTKEGVTSVTEQYSTGVFDAVQQELIYQEELKSSPCIQEMMDNLQREQTEDMEVFICKQRRYMVRAQMELLEEHYQTQREQAEKGKFQLEQREEALERLQCEWIDDVKAVLCDQQKLWREFREQTSQPGQTSNTVNNITIKDVHQRKWVIHAQLINAHRRYQEELEHFQKDLRERTNDFRQGR